MKILLYLIGKTTAGYLREGIEIYCKRLSHYVPFEIKQMPDVRATKGMTESVQKVKEGEMFLEQIRPADYVVLLDERGKEMTSREFAMYLDKRMASAGAGNIIFVIGGPYGFSEAMYERADSKVSFSRMTCSHEMIRLLFVEQVYRAMTILRGEPYHHD